jgi:DNA-binding response OmpR family regulator
MGRRVLIADDEPNIVAALEYLLQRSGYQVHIARNGDDALRLIEEHRPDLVLLDVMMPLRSGYDVCQRMREHEDWRHIKIVMLSAKGREVEVNKGMSLGADLYITKPFSNRDLVAKIDGLLAASDIAPQHGDSAKL